MMLALSVVIATPLTAKTNLNSLRTKAWNEWKQVYQKNTKETLPMLDSLGKESTFKWEIPASLEPNATMPFYYGAKGEKPTAGYPLFVYMHGSGPKQIEWITGHKLAMKFADSPSVYAIPQIPNEGEYYRWWQRGKQWCWERLLRLAFMEEAIDPARVYFFGISEGGYGSQRLAAYYADYLAAAAPMAGGEPLRNAPAENLCNMPFSLRTGEKDLMFYRCYMTANVEHVLDSLGALYPGEYKHYIEIQPGRGHGIDYRGASPWMSQYSRKPQPKRFRWENFEMDGIKRNAFYNLQVLEEDTATSRVFYDVKIEKNVVELTVSNVEYETTFTDPNWNIPFLFQRHLTPAHQGKVRVFLSEDLVDLAKPVIVRVNGKECYNKTLNTSKSQVLRAMKTALDCFGDPLRIFPAAVEIQF